MTLGVLATTGCPGDDSAPAADSGSTTSADGTGTTAVAETTDPGDTTAAGSEESGTTGDNSADFPNCSCDEFETGTCYAVTADDEEGLQIAANTMGDGDALVLGLGVFELDNQVTIRGDDITVCGQGMGEEGNFEMGTILDFASQAAQSNGLDAVGDRFTVRDLALVDAKKDGLRVEDSDFVTIQRVRATWRTEGSSKNGAYGLYPVSSNHVLIEDSEAYNSADAGIYVGQCQNAIVRNNIAMGNVAGIEIENTQFADVYGNHAEDNTGGLLIFDLPGNPIFGRDISVHDNVVINNNRTNFAAGGTVQAIPVGTGTFAMASRRVEIFNNTYADNATMDIALISGLVIEGNEESWGIPVGEVVGDIDGLDLPTDGKLVYSYRTDNVLVHDNTHSGSGTNPTLSSFEQELGLLLAFVYGANLPVDSLLYGTIGESSFDPADPAMNSNDNHICLGDTNDGATFASLNIGGLLNDAGEIIGTFDDLYRPDAPFTPFDCGEFQAGPIIPPDMD
ncbi:MAG: parallel beta-helix domain-containing protein [Myxococcota bacterium]